MHVFLSAYHPYLIFLDPNKSTNAETKLKLKELTSKEFLEQHKKLVETNVSPPSVLIMVIIQLLLIQALQLARFQRAYKVVKAPRGKFVIFNNEQFSGDLTERIGSEFDVKRLTQLAKCLQMQPVVYKDLTAKVRI